MKAPEEARDLTGLLFRLRGQGIRWDCPEKVDGVLSYAAIAAAACFSNCTGLRYPSDECRRDGL